MFYYRNACMSAAVAPNEINIYEKFIRLLALQWAKKNICVWPCFHGNKDYTMGFVLKIMAFSAVLILFFSLLLFHLTYMNNAVGTGCEHKFPFKNYLHENMRYLSSIL